MVDAGDSSADVTIGLQFTIGVLDDNGNAQGYNSEKRAADGVWGLVTGSTSPLYYHTDIGRTLRGEEVYNYREESTVNRSLDVTCTPELMEAREKIAELQREVEAQEAKVKQAQDERSKLDGNLKELEMDAIEARIAAAGGAGLMEQLGERMGDMLALPDSSNTETTD